jgi:DNA (cytosine-5)-methyltransferase 1
MNFYNEHDPKAAAWIRELIAAKLIPDGVVDERSITEIKANELTHYAQCHFFAGIGGWSLALALAGWTATRPVWTGSCPCQPFSNAGKGLAQADERHLWPAFFNLIRECRPECVIGEQVEGAIGKGWLDGIQTDLEGEGYALGSVVLGAHSLGAPHIRQRLFWVADSKHAEWRAELQEHGDAYRGDGFGGSGELGGLADAGHAESSGRELHTEGSDRGARDELTPYGADCDGVGESNKSGPQGHGRLDGLNDSQGRQGKERHHPEAGFWSIFDIIPCRDGKARRIESGTFPLVDGIPGGVVPGSDPSVSEAQATAEARVMRLKGYGNAIVPVVASEFLIAYLEIKSEP